MLMEKQTHSKIAMILMSFFLGHLGVHRYLMGYSNWWLQLITFGGFGIWTLVDFIRIIIGDMKMADGRELI
jgi:TM2 domain-containing membrane protein YozV